MLQTGRLFPDVTMLIAAINAKYRTWLNQ